MQVVAGFHNQPTRTQHGVGGGQRQGNTGAKHDRPQGVRKAGDVAAQHPALCHSHDVRAYGEDAVPKRFVVDVCLDPKVKRHTAQNQTDQHDGHRQVQSREDHAVRQWKGGEQYAHTQH